jgi:hypothetical protein
LRIALFQKKYMKSGLFKFAPKPKRKKLGVFGIVGVRSRSNSY